MDLDDDGTDASAARRARREQTPSDATPGPTALRHRTKRRPRPHRVTCRQEAAPRPRERVEDPAIRAVAHGDRIAVHIVVALDLHTVGSLRDVLVDMIAAGFTDIVVVLTGVGLIDSTGLGVLVAAHERVLGCGGRLELVVDQESLMKVLRITALTQVFVVHPTLEAALAA